MYAILFFVSVSNQNGGTCPSCGRFVGPLEECPYCGAHIKKRLPLKYLRLACLLLAVSGVVVLLYAVSGSATPTTKIGGIGATMNYAYIRVEGLVTRGPIYDADAESIRFYIADDTGEIQAVAFRDVTRQLRAQDKVPATGDKIYVEGTLRIRDDLNSFNIASADKLILSQPASNEIRIKDIGRDDEYHYVRVRGDVREIREPYQGLTLVTLGDASGEVEVAVNADVEKLYGAPEAFQLGDSLEVQGVVTYFRDLPQLLLRNPRDLKRLEVENTAAEVQKIGDLDSARVNRLALVSGQITRVSKFSQGIRAGLADPTGEITLVLWKDVYDGIPNASELRIGAQVTILGKVSEYHGEMEILPHNATDVRIAVQAAQDTETAELKVAPTASGNTRPTTIPSPTRPATAAPAARTVGSITPPDKGARVILTAKITRANNFAQGMRYTLDDGTGNIVMLIWSDVLDKIPIRGDLIAGAEVRVTGKIDAFNDALEVIPARADDVELVAAAVVPTVTIRTIDSISTADLDRTVFVQGTISEISNFSAGKYVMLRDESGTIRVTVFRNVLAAIQDRLAIGETISVRGKVNLYRGDLELVADEIGF